MQFTLVHIVASSGIFRVVILDWNQLSKSYSDELLSFAKLIFVFDFAEWAHLYFELDVRKQEFYYALVKPWRSGQCISNVMRDTPRRLEIKTEVGKRNDQSKAILCVRAIQPIYLYLMNWNKDLRIKFPCFRLFEDDILDMYMYTCISKFMCLVYTTQVNSAFRAIWLVLQSWTIKCYSPSGGIRRKKWLMSPILSENKATIWQLLLNLLYILKQLFASV